jgi:hypothetical protein
VTTDEEREETMREITALADEAGVAHSEMSYERAYLEALKDFGGTGRDSPHGVRLRELAAEIDERVVAARRAAARETEERSPSRKSVIIRVPGRRSPGDITITISRDCLQCVGLVAGDEVRATPTDDLKPGDVAAVQGRGADHYCLGRVVASGATHITLRDDEGDFTRELAALVWTGRVDHKNPTKGSTLPEAERERVEELRERIEKLGREDDQIIRCTALYKLEKEIFDIEHPVGKGEGSDDWGAWEEADDE